MNYLIETKKHIERVQSFLKEIQTKIALRSYDHDSNLCRGRGSFQFREICSTLNVTEQNEEIHALYLEKLKNLHAKFLTSCKYHPSSHENGISGMNLIDLLEFLADMKADFMPLKEVIEENQKLFNYTDEVKAILLNTARYLGWLNEQ